MRLYISINLNKIFWNFSFPSVDTNHNFSSPALPVNQSCFRFGWQLFVIIWSRVLSLCPLCWSRLIGMIEICSWSGDAFPSRWAMVSLQNCGCVFNTTTWTEFLSQQHRDLTHFKFTYDFRNKQIRLWRWNNQAGGFMVLHHSQYWKSCASWPHNLPSAANKKLRMSFAKVESNRSEGPWVTPLTRESIPPLIMSNNGLALKKTVRRQRACESSW